MPIALVPVVCEQCGLHQKAPKGAIWPVGCHQCTGDTAPSWWFRENNQPPSIKKTSQKMPSAHRMEPRDFGQLAEKLVREGIWTRREMDDVILALREAEKQLLNRD